MVKEKNVIHACDQGNGSNLVIGTGTEVDEFILNDSKRKRGLPN